MRRRTSKKEKEEEIPMMTDILMLSDIIPGIPYYQHPTTGVIYYETTSDELVREYVQNAYPDYEFPSIYALYESYWIKMNGTEHNDGITYVTKSGIRDFPYTGFQYHHGDDQYINFYPDNLVTYSSPQGHILLYGRGFITLGGAYGEGSFVPAIIVKE